MCVCVCVCLVRYAGRYRLTHSFIHSFIHSFTPCFLFLCTELPPCTIAGGYTKAKAKAKACNKKQDSRRYGGNALLIGIRT